MLSIKSLTVAYGGLKALVDVSVEVAEGQFIAIVGPNGAGKTTLFKTISGIVQPVSGSIMFDGKDLLAIPPAQRAHLGIAHVPEGRQVFRSLTVLENLEMGAHSIRGRADWARNLGQILELFPVLAERRDQLAGTLSGGERQMLALGRALMSRPRLLMLDEPSMGLAPMMVQKIFETIHNIAAQGMSILLVEQNARLALQVAQRGYVMESGIITLTGAASELLGSNAVQRAYLGG